MGFDLDGWRANRTARFDAWLETALPAVWPVEFDAPLRYPVFSGGKRVRPLLAFASFEAVSKAPIDNAFPAGGAIELVHTYSLVHDDLPCMDDDDERRGRPTVHKAWDEGTAVLVGDALLTHAFGLLASAPWSAESRIEAVGNLTREAGAMGMVGGQAGDIGMAGPVTELNMLTRIHNLKTGALIRATCILGGLAAEAGPGEIAALSLYGTHVGLAFQLADDVLDADEDAGKDGPPNIVELLGVDETRRRARQASEAAIAALTALDRPEALIALANFTIQRDH